MVIGKTKSFVIFHFKKVQKIRGTPPLPPRVTPTLATPLQVIHKIFTHHQSFYYDDFNKHSAF